MSDQQDRTDDLVRWAMDAEVPADVKARLRRRLGEFERKAARAEPRKRYWLPGGAAAGLLLAAVALLAWLSAGRPDAVTWAQVQKSTREVPWVHTVQKDAATGQVQGEAWAQTAPPRRFYKPTLGRRMQAVLLDYAAREKWWYTPDAEALTIYPIAEDEAPPGLIFLDVLDPEKRPPPIQSVERAESKDDIIRFDIFAASADERQTSRLAMQVWVDAASGLPTRAESIGKSGRPTAVFVIDYPKTGPADVFDLGIPRTVQIRDARPPADLQRVVATYRACRAAFPDRYRAVMASDTEFSYVIERNGRKERRESYFPPVQRATPEVLDARVDLLQEESVPPGDVAVFDGRQAAVWDLDDGKSVYDRRGHGLLAQGIDIYVTGASLPDQPMHRITSDDPKLKGMVGIRIEGMRDHKGRERGDEFWLNPARDYLVHRFLWRVKDEDGWQVLWREQVLEYGRLPSGQWYRRRWRTVGTHVDSVTCLDVQENPEFAEGTFDVDAPSPWGSAVLDVVDPEGEPVEVSEIVALDAHDLGRRDGERGRIVLSGLPPDRPQEFLLTQEERGLVGKAVVTVQPGAEVHRKVTLGPGVRLSGSMVDVEGNPVAGAQARLLVRTSSELPIPLGAYCKGTETDAAGRYELGCLCPGLEYVIQPWKGGMAAAQRKVEVDEDAGLATVEEIVFNAATAFLAGRVTTGDDEPLEGLEVVCRLKTPASDRQPILWPSRAFGAERVAETDGVGDYRFGPLSEGSTYLLYLRAPGYDDAEKEATPGEGRVDFVLTPLRPSVPVE